MPGENTLTNRANSVNESFQYSKRSMSEMQRSCELKVVVNKPSILPRFKDTQKSQIKTLNGVKTVSIKNLTDSTKSVERSTTRRHFSKTKKTPEIPPSDPNPNPHQNLHLHLNSSNPKLTSTHNNSSISSLKLTEKSLKIDL